MAITRMNHFTVLCEDLATTVKFYVDVLGLREGPRPPLGIPGAWLYAGDEPVLHVVAGRALPNPPGGVLDHMAFSAENLRDVAARLSAAGVAVSLGRQPQTGVWQLFFHDPNGARVELDFAADEAAPT
jgi:catechol 2,3-dioxygenase-like lactoylglutathione lyase family enzyme